MHGAGEGGAGQNSLFVIYVLDADCQSESERKKRFKKSEKGNEVIFTLVNISSFNET